MNKPILCGALMVMAFAAPAALPGEAGAQQTITCSSQDERRTTCAADTRGGAYLSRQISRAPCEYDRTWGYTPGGIWVSNGCRAEFVVDIPPATTPISAADALRVCRNTVAARMAMTNPSVVRVEIHPPDDQDGRSVGWSTSDGRAGSCRVNANGEVTGWLVRVPR